MIIIITQISCGEDGDADAAGDGDLEALKRRQNEKGARKGEVKKNTQMSMFILNRWTLELSPSPCLTPPLSIPTERRLPCSVDFLTEDLGKVAHSLQGRPTMILTNVPFGIRSGAREVRSPRGSRGARGPVTEARVNEYTATTTTTTHNNNDNNNNTNSNDNDIAYTSNTSNTEHYLSRSARARDGGLG